MQVVVAGAGAGKTSMMAGRITDYHIPDGKILFCVAFTNAATENIAKKVAAQLGCLPENIKISTIHSFLYQELIKPYYYLLYKQRFDKISSALLPANNIAKSQKLAALEREGIIHIATFPQKAKWVVARKSSDKKDVISIRRKILQWFSSYCAAIFVDEAQDIDDDLKQVLEALASAGISVFLFGDPKQDIRGSGAFRKIVTSAPTPDVSYQQNCYRCPQVHLNISNLLAPDQEKQTTSGQNVKGTIEIVYENDLADLLDFMDKGGFGLRYISQKQGSFTTRSDAGKTRRFENVYSAIYRMLIDKWEEAWSELELNRCAFYWSERVSACFEAGEDVMEVIGEMTKKNLVLGPPEERYAQLEPHLRPDTPCAACVVSSIASIKGLQDERCLFVLSPDLAPYLFRIKKEENRMSHLLYVALTRSSRHLTIMVSKEVENKYSRKEIQAHLCCIGINAR